eukprot:365052-Chlamydomonas_euryale.AAC.9
MCGEDGCHVRASVLNCLCICAFPPRCVKAHNGFRRVLVYMQGGEALVWMQGSKLCSSVIADRRSAAAVAYICGCVDASVRPHADASTCQCARMMCDV